MGKLTRRAFIATGLLAGGGIALGIAVRPDTDTSKFAELLDKQDSPSGVLVNAWLKILPDNSISVILPHVEMGQGAHTALAMMMADELDADWSTVSIEQAPSHELYSTYHVAREFLLPSQVPELLEDTVNGTFLQISKQMSLQITGGSFSIRGTGERAMRVYGATARQLFVQAAAQQWGVPESEVTVANSVITHAASGRSEPFITFASAIASQRGEVRPTLKTPDQYTIMGKDIARLDAPAKVNGTATFGVDVELPDMLYATIQHTPVFGTRVKSYDESAIAQLKGVEKVVDLGNAVAVIADSYWTAKKALPLLNIQYTAPESIEETSAQIFAKQSKVLDEVDAGGESENDFNIGEGLAAFENADSTLDVEYRLPILAHACMEPMNCTAQVSSDGGSIEVWGGFQNGLRVRNHMVKELGFDKDQVKVNITYLGGGFGRRSTTDYPDQAAKLAQAVPGRPVKLIWPREEDTRQDVYRTQSIGRFRAALDQDRQPVAWESLYVDKNEPQEASTLPYAIPNQYGHFVQAPSHVPFGPWRSVDHTQHAFFIESFIDELANEAGEDAYQFRRKLLKGLPRDVAVLDKVAEMSNWDRPLPPNHGRGIAVHEAFGTKVAEVVEVEVNGSTLDIKKVYCCADPGFAVHPDGFKAQMESGIIYGLTAAVYGDIQIEAGAVKQSNFHDYRMLRMHEAPDIEVEIINSGARIGGGGEPSTPPVSPALVNAIFNATGQRLRELPVSKAFSAFA